MASRTLHALSDTDDFGEVRCTWFPDLMIRETRTDSPAPGPVSLVPSSRKSRAPCTRTRPLHEQTLDVSGYAFNFRKGPFLIFNYVDANGADPFKVLRTLDGRTIFEDGMTDTGPDIIAVGLRHGLLYLHYVRSFNAPCSIMQDPAECWASLIKTGLVPRVTAVRARRACSTSYARMKAPSGDPSMISYETEITLSLEGRIHVLSRGPVSCAPVP